MGYDVHITRKENWSDEEGEIIALEEWLAVLDSDPELCRATDAGEDTLAGAWRGETLFWYSDGEITCKNPEEAVIRKMVEIARRLNANVQGDEGERYPEAFGPSEPALEPLPHVDPNPPVTGRTPCHKCSYLLRGLPRTGLCPECGAPIMESVRAEREVSSAERFGKRIELLWRIVVIGAAMVFGLILIMGILGRW